MIRRPVARRGWISEHIVWGVEPHHSRWCERALDGPSYRRIKQAAVVANNEVAIAATILASSLSAAVSTVRKPLRFGERRSVEHTTSLPKSDERPIPERSCEVHGQRPPISHRRAHRRVVGRRRRVFPADHQVHLGVGLVDDRDVAHGARLSRLVVRSADEEQRQAQTGDPNELVLLHEHLNTELSGTVTIFECRVVTSQYVYRVRAVDGDPVFVAFGIIDVPRPYAVGVNGDGVITIYGLPDPKAPTLQQVVNADPTTWAALPTSRYP